MSIAPVLSSTNMKRPLRNTKVTSLMIWRSSLVAASALNAAMLATCTGKLMVVLAVSLAIQPAFQALAVMVVVAFTVNGAL